MPRQLPPLNALKAFEAAARSESFTRAAEELCVTQGAVSHQVKALEATLGIKLFNRERQRLVITDAGREYLNVVRDALDRIAAGTCSAKIRVFSPLAHRRILRPSGWYIDSDGLPRPTPASICGFPQRCIMSTSFGRRSTLRLGTATAIGAALMLSAFAPNSCFRSAVPS